MDKETLAALTNVIHFADMRIRSGPLADDITTVLLWMGETRKEIEQLETLGTTPLVPFPQR